MELYEHPRHNNVAVDLPYDYDIESNLSEVVLYFGSPKIWTMLMSFIVDVGGMDIAKLIHHLFGRSIRDNASECKWYWLVNYLLLHDNNVELQGFGVCLHRLLKLRDDLVKLASAHDITLFRVHMYREWYNMDLWSPLHEVVAAGSLSNVQVMLDYAEPANSVYHCAFNTGHDFWLYGFTSATASGQDYHGAPDGITPLHVAASRGALAIAKYFIETWDVDPHAETTHFKLNALDFALIFGHKETALYFMEEHGLKPRITTSNRSTWRANEVLGQSVDSVIDGYASIRQKHPLQFSIYAAQHVPEIMADVSISEVNRPDERGRTPLYWAISRLRRKATEGTALIKYLIEEKYANPIVRDHEGSTPFHHAALSANQSLLTYLMDMPHIVSRLPQPRAASWHTLHKIRLLLATDQQGDTARTLVIHHVKGDRAKEIVAQLLYKEAQGSLSTLAQMVLQAQKRVSA